MIFSADDKSAIRFLFGPGISEVKYWFQKEYVFDTIYPYIAQPVNGHSLNSPTIQSTSVPPRFGINFDRDGLSG